MGGRSNSRPRLLIRENISLTTGLPWSWEGVTLPTNNFCELFLLGLPCPPDLVAGLPTLSSLPGSAWECCYSKLRLFSFPNTCPPKRMAGWPDCVIQAGNLGIRFKHDAFKFGRASPSQRGSSCRPAMSCLPAMLSRPNDCSVGRVGGDSTFDG